MGDDVVGSQPVFVITMHGDFVGYMASVPPGGDLPRGHVLTLVVDADPGSRLDDWGLSATDADLSPLGDGVALGG